ncbi:MAG: C1 family peptidase, partial [Prevotella sp.]
MNKTIFLFSIAIALASGSTAQTNNGGISQEMLDGFRKAQKMTAADKALSNALAANSIDNLAFNRANSHEPDTYFSVETKKQSINDQQSSGRCWMFSGFNVLRSNFTQRADSLVLELSHSYLFFWDQLEKANLFLQGAIETAEKPLEDQRVQFFFKNPINDGGTFCGVADLADKYGLVPKSVMPESYSTDNTSRMARLISSKLREFGLQLRDMVAAKKKPAAIKEEKTKMLGTIYKMLAITIGEPPAEFTYIFKTKDGKNAGTAKTYTPQTFYKEVVGEEPINGSFIMAMNDPRREYYKTYRPSPLVRAYGL